MGALVYQEMSRSTCQKASKPCRRLTQMPHHTLPLDSGPDCQTLSALHPGTTCIHAYKKILLKDIRRKQKQSLSQWINKVVFYLVSRSFITFKIENSRLLWKFQTLLPVTLKMNHRIRTGIHK